MSTFIFILFTLLIFFGVVAAIKNRSHVVPNEAKSYSTTVAGVTKKNSDGKSRQQIIKDLVYPGMSLRLEAEPTNPYDPKAVVIYAADDQLGYLPRGYHTDTFNALKEGRQITATVEEITGGTSDKRNRGVVITLTKYPN